MEAAVALAPAPRAATLQTDTDLVAAVRRGDDRAFEELYGRYSRRISSYIFGMVKDHARAEDLTQDVFMSALRRMRDTDRPIAFKPWVYEIAKNACIDQFRRNKRAEEVSYDAEEGLGAADYGRLVNGDPTPDVALDHKQQLDHLRGALGGLSEAHHQILVMREFEGLSYREIGERMQMSRPSVESTLFRARKRLSEEYEELITGARCTRIQSIITTAGGSGLGARDRRRMARHLSYCQGCRRTARAAGLGDVVPARTAIGAKIAAFLPLPAFLRRRVVGDAEATAAAGNHSGSLAQWSANLGPMLDSTAAGWAKAVATAATVAVAGVGAGAMTTGNPVRLAKPLSAASLFSANGKSATASATPVRSSRSGGLSAAAAAGSVAVPPRSAAGAPTKLREGAPAPAGKDGAPAVEEMSAGSADPSSQPKGAAQEEEAQGLDGVTRQLGIGGRGDGKDKGGGDQGGDDSSGGDGGGLSLPGVPTGSGSGADAQLPAGTADAVSAGTKAGTDVVGAVDAGSGGSVSGAVKAVTDAVGG